MMAFASAGGVKDFFDVPAMGTLASRGEMQLFVGLDAITTPAVLENLRDREQSSRGHLTVRVIMPSADFLFHPKFFLFQTGEASGSLVVGSGNMTVGGLADNVEAFSVVRLDAGGLADANASIDGFLTRHKVRVRPIDDEAMHAAAENVLPGRPPQRRPGPGPGSTTALSGAFLIAEVPKSGNRWRQVNFTQNVMDTFFRVQPGGAVRMRAMRADSTLEAEEMRARVDSGPSHNFRVELKAEGPEAYPRGGRPIALIRRHGARFIYRVYLPSAPEHAELDRLLGQSTTPSREVRRLVLTAAQIQASWAQCPMLRTI